MTMKNIQLTLSKDLLKTDYQWLNRDLKKGEQVYLCTTSTYTYGCIGKNGVTCGNNDIDCFFKLPTTAITLKHENKVFGIFMTEQGMGYQLFYCKEFPINHNELLTKTQSNVHLIDSNKGKPVYKTENQILKVMIKNGKASNEIAQLEDVAPLF
jgi:hypothetical protein